MKCPECSHTESKVKKTLIHEWINEGLSFGELKKRERECKECKAKFFSYEVTEKVFRKMLLPKRRPLKTKLDRPDLDLNKTHV